MGWCGATRIMDAALAAADELLTQAYDALGVDSARVTLDDIRPDMDAVLSPFVASLAEELRNADWDCIQESKHFHRFPQEMLGMDRRDYETHLIEQLQYATDIKDRVRLVRALHDLHEKAGR